MVWSISTRPMGFLLACTFAQSASPSASSRSGSGPSAAAFSLRGQNALSVQPFDKHGRRSGCGPTTAALSPYVRFVQAVALVPACAACHGARAGMVTQSCSTQQVHASRRGQGLAPNKTQPSPPAQAEPQPGRVGTVAEEESSALIVRVVAVRDRHGAQVRDDPRRRVLEAQARSWRGVLAGGAECFECAGHAKVDVDDVVRGHRGGWLQGPPEEVKEVFAVDFDLGEGVAGDGLGAVGEAAIGRGRLEAAVEERLAVRRRNAVALVTLNHGCAAARHSVGVWNPWGVNLGRGQDPAR